MKNDLLVYIGYDPREDDGYQVTKRSILDHSKNATVEPIVLADCINQGLYNRPTTTIDGHLYDEISDAPMATEFAISRFLVPFFESSRGEKWAVFMDCDILVQCDIRELLKFADDRYAVMCVKHDDDHGEGVKMDGCKQTAYPRKNWSSVMLWNLEHPANVNRLSLTMVNSMRGLHLHQFQWLNDDEIGELPSEFNHLVGVQPANPNAKIIHYTLGIPTMQGYSKCDYAQSWWDTHTAVGDSDLT